LLATNDYHIDLNTANELYKIGKNRFKIGAIGQYVEEIESLQEAGVDFVYDHYAQLGKEFAIEFLEFIDREKRTIHR